MKEEKHGTLEELKEDIKNCGFHADSDMQVSLETLLAQTRIQIDTALTEILQKSGLPLFLFDYLISSVQNDIRKADLDVIRAGIMNNTSEG